MLSLTASPLGPEAPTAPAGPGMPRAPGNPGAPATPGTPCQPTGKRACYSPLIFSAALMDTETTKQYMYLQLHL